MSSSNRTTSKGGKAAKADKTYKSDKSDSGKTSDKYQRDSTTSKFDDPIIKDKVRQVIDVSECSEDKVIFVLHECDYDVELAIDMLLENRGHSEWETRVKKKKNRQALAGKQDKTEETVGGDGDEWNDGFQVNSNQNATTTGGDRDNKGRNKIGSGTGRPYGRHGNDTRGWRGREQQENERNLDGDSRHDYSNRGGDRRGRGGSGGGGGTVRGGNARGRGGGRAGGRYPPRNRSNNYSKPIETWDNSTANAVAGDAANHTGENWDDFPGTDEWSVEEYTGSLADTKIFTPSIQQQQAELAESEQQIALELQAAAAAAAAAANNNGQQTLQIAVGGGSPNQPLQIPAQSPVPITGTLNAAQTQYLNQLTQQSCDNIKTYAANVASTQVYSANSTANVANYSTTQPYGTNSFTGNVNNNFGSRSDQPTQQPVRSKTQRARVPPPSKIPSSAVEMPGDINSIGFLDVQFGAMDFMSDNSTFDNTTVGDTKFNNATTNSLDSTTISSTNNIDLSVSNQNSSLDAYSVKSNTQGSISSALTQNLSDSIPQTSEHLTGAYNIAPRSSSTGCTTTPSVTSAGLELNKPTETHSYQQPTTYSSYQTKSSTFNTSPYSGAQATSTSYVSNQPNSYVNSQSSTYNTPNSNAYPNAYTSTNSYQTNTNTPSFSSITQANTYSSNSQTFPQSANQSVYGTNTGLTSNSNFANTSTSQYNNYTSANSHKLGKENVSTVSNTQTTTSNNVTSSATLSMSQTTVSGAKSTTTLAVKNSSGIVSNIPPGVAPVMSTPYIMGQVPYFQQPVYAYEDVQLLQQRLPHMTTPFYDMNYQTSTTLAAVRDATLGNVGYSISDGRFTRGDNNASPVPTTLSQQTSTLTQGHQAQPILASTGPPYFFTAFNTLAPNYQYSAAMYTQLPNVTNAHGTSNSNQYPKPGTYGSAYGNYDTLSQTQDYNKTGFVGNNAGQKGTGVNATSTGSNTNDLSAMYGKSHAALGKVNSYEKQTFHSGTPPPFTGALHGGQNAGLAPSGPGYPQVYISTMAPHQQPLSTQLMHQPLHQMDMRHQGRRTDSGSSGGQRSQTTNQAKSGAKQSYTTSYWNQP